MRHSRRTKVGQQNPVTVYLGRVGEKYILRFQVAVNYAFLVKILKPSNHLPNDDTGIQLMDSGIMPIDERPQVSSRSKLGERITVIRLVMFKVPMVFDSFVPSQRMG